jgi:phosphatidylglycerophosphatase A
MKIISYILGTGFGSGYSPIAPGTAGSLAAALIYYFTPTSNSLIWLPIIIITYFIGVYTATIIEKDAGHDPGLIVIDEFAGQWLTYLFLPKTYFVMIAGFFLFRLFDIVKPWPANNSQNLKAGWGVMTDDIFAGLYANIVLQLLLYWGLTL